MPVKIDQRISSIECHLFHFVELRIRTSSVDCLAVYLEPLTEIQQSFLLNHWNDAIRCRTYIKSHTSTCSDSLCEVTNQLFRSEIVGQRLIAIKSKGAAYAAAFCPRSVSLCDTSAVFRSTETILRSVTPAVVDDSILAHCIIIPSDEFSSVPLLSGVTPFSVREND